MGERYVLDSHAMMALLENEKGSQLVADLITSDDTEIHMSVVNLGEVYYIVMREYGEESAVELEEKVLQTGKIKIADAPWERVKAAARLKTMGGLSFADCFGAALARELEATLVTGDPEFEKLERTARFRVLWLA
ncbi:MAG: type II toxin-antitoxin system VapC family toxin [Bacillota bacterium]|nr:type II toxin-antitoxin system VapC family toxin [Bacillota bacterium]